MALPSYIKVKDEAVYFNSDGEFIFFVPDSYYEKKIAVANGEYVEVFGILSYALYTKIQDDEITKPKAIKQFYFPSKFITKPGKITKIKNFKLTDNYTDDFTLLHYTNNNIDQIITSVKVAQNIANVEDFFRVWVKAGSIPTTLKYHDLYKPFMDSIRISGNSYGLPACSFGVLISELCRDPNDINKPFRLGTALDNDPCSYKPISIKDVPKVVSPFVSLTSENFDKAIVGAIMNKNNEDSPLEKVLTG